MNDHLITLRTVREEDEKFLIDLFASTRETELSLLPWNAQQKETFVCTQYSAQSLQYRSTFPDLDSKIILRDGKAVGRILIFRSRIEIRVIDISLLPSFRNAGIGTRLLRTILTEAHSTHRHARLHVALTNRARGLYERLGFRELRNNGIYVEMESSPVSALEVVGSESVTAKE